jgi:hypothetical protein
VDPVLGWSPISTSAWQPAPVTQAECHTDDALPLGLRWFQIYFDPFR